MKYTNLVGVFVDFNNDNKVILCTNLVFQCGIRLALSSLLPFMCLPFSLFTIKLAHVFLLHSTFSFLHRRVSLSLVLLRFSINSSFLQISKTCLLEKLFSFFFKKTRTSIHHPLSSNILSHT